MHLAVVELLVNEVNITTTTPPNLYHEVDNAGFATFITKHENDRAFQVKVTTVTMMGGGNDGKIGVAKVIPGFLQNGTDDQGGMAYSAGGYGESILNGTFPVLDVYKDNIGNGAALGVGGTTAFGLASTVAPADYKNGLNGGLTFPIADYDAPTMLFQLEHQFPITVNNDGLPEYPIDLDDTRTFVDYLSAVSDDFKFTYSAFYSVEWSMDTTFAWNSTTSQWDDGGTAASITKKQSLATGFAPPAVKAPIWWGNTAISYY